MMSLRRPTRLLAVDSASPLVSVALGSGDHVLARRSVAIAHSSEALLRTIDEVLSAAGTTLEEVEGLVGLRGPGSFTGLRVGLATLLGLHQALGTPATALPTLEVLALAAPSTAQRVVAVVDALRGEWFSQLLVNGAADGAPAIRSPAAIADLAPDAVVGHSIEALSEALPAETETATAGELAPLALRFAASREIEWEPSALLDPFYLRSPAVLGRD